MDPPLALGGGLAGTLFLVARDAFPAAKDDFIVINLLILVLLIVSVKIAVVTVGEVRQLAGSRVADLRRFAAGNPNAAFDAGPPLRVVLYGPGPQIELRAAPLTGGTEAFSVFAPPPAFFLRIAPEGTVHRIGKLFGMQDIITGSLPFDAAYLIQGNDEAFVREFLDGPAMDAIARLRRLGDAHEVAVTPAGLSVRAPARSFSELTGLVETARVLHRRYAEVARRREAAAAAAAAAPPGAVAGPRCLVCGAPVVGPWFACARCDAPHHPECWQFLGACATYGCGGTKARVHPGKKVPSAKREAPRA